MSKIRVSFTPVNKAYMYIAKKNRILPLKVIFILAPRSGVIHDVHPSLERG